MNSVSRRKEEKKAFRHIQNTPVSEDVQLLWYWTSGAPRFGSTGSRTSIVGYSVGILCSYYFARFWVFQLNNNFRFIEMIKFISVYIIGGLSMTFIIFCLNHYLNIDYRVSWIGGALFAIMNNYLGSKHLVFKKTNI